MHEDQDKKGLTRREFIRAAGATAAGVIAGSLISDSAMAAPASARVIGANDRINIGIIGVGGMGGGHIHTLKAMEEEQNIRVVAVCDVWEKRRLDAQKTADVPDRHVYSDYRKLLEHQGIDEVVVATPDHWHSPICIDAMEAGKHVYVEKPMTRYLGEAIAMRETAKRTKRLVQVGSQGCTDAKWHKAGELVKAGRIGTLIWAQGGYSRNNPNGEWNYYIDPEANEQNLDWKAWLGSARKRPWSPERYFRWRKYWDYGTGIIGDLWPHRLHPLMIAMDMREFPKRVSCVGGNLCETDVGKAERRDVADSTMLMVEFPSGAMIFLAGSTVNERGVEDMIRGQKGNLYFGGGKVRIEPERPFADEVEAKDESVVGPGESHAEHHKNFLHCIRTGETPNCDIELGVRVQTIVSMAERSYRESKMIVFDAEKMKMIG